MRCVEEESELLGRLTVDAESNQQPIKGSPKAKAMEPGKGSETIPQGSRAKARSTPSLETEKMI